MNDYNHINKLFVYLPSMGNGMYTWKKGQYYSNIMQCKLKKLYQFPPSVK